MRLPGAVGIDFRDRRGMRRGASEILTSLMLVYVANLGMDYVVCGPGAIAGPATHRSSSSAMSRTRLERLIEQGDVPFITQPAARASDLVPTFIEASNEFESQMSHLFASLPARIGDSGY
jgi:ABC-type uncharacterized transport system permease subunit